MRCLCVDSSPAINHIHQALETTSPVHQPSAVPCTEFHHSKFFSSWNQLTLFFLIKATYWTEVSFFTPKIWDFSSQVQGPILVYSLGQVIGALQPGMERHSPSGRDAQHLFLLRMTRHIITLKCEISIDSKSPSKITFDVGNTILIILI